MDHCEDCNDMGYTMSLGGAKIRCWSCDNWKDLK